MKKGISRLGIGKEVDMGGKILGTRGIRLGIGMGVDMRGKILGTRGIRLGMEEVGMRGKILATRGIWMGNVRKGGVRNGEIVRFSLVSKII